MNAPARDSLRKNHIRLTSGRAINLIMISCERQDRSRKRISKRINLQRRPNGLWGKILHSSFPCFSATSLVFRISLLWRRLLPISLFFYLLMKVSRRRLVFCLPVLCVRFVNLKDLNGLNSRVLNLRINVKYANSNGQFYNYVGRVSANFAGGPFILACRQTIWPSVICFDCSLVPHFLT